MDPGPDSSDDSGSNSDSEKIAIAVKIPVHSCFRESPRPCINQDLVDELAILRSHRKLEWGSDHHKFISYATAISAIISCPFKITSKKQALAIPHVGEKLGNKIAEFLEHGQIHQAQIISQSESYQTKRMFSQVHGIGWKTAEVLYQRGLRTLDDLERTGEYNLKYHADSLIKVGREEVESIKNFVQVQLDRMDEKKGSGVKAVITICGGYRRGKVLSNDIDLLITYPHSEDGYEKGVLEDLLRRLQSKGLIPPDGILSHSFPGTARITESNRPAALFDCLDKAFVVFCHKRNGTTRMRDYYRRVDLIVTRWKSYGSALLGWTGSTQWERDIRKHGHAIGYNFGAGGLRTIAGDEPIDTSYEKDIFRIMNIPYIEPELRNADP